MLEVYGFIADCVTYPVPLQRTVRNCAPDRIAAGAVHAEVRLRIRHGPDGHHW